MGLNMPHKNSVILPIHMNSVSHVTSSPHYPQSNGQVERMVQTIKGLLMKSDDPCPALLAYRLTPFPWCELSPAELLMGRRLRSGVPLAKTLLMPEWKTSGVKTNCSKPGL